VPLTVTGISQESAMTDNEWQALIDLLGGVEYQFGITTAESPVHRIEFAPGLTDAEVETTEDRFGFRFPPDLRAFLQTALPRGPQFPDWRSPDLAKLREWLDIPRQGVLFDVEHNAFWLDEWGPQPRAMADALALVGGLIRAAPRLIPIYSHRMMPDEPHMPGNPVFSVHQADIIHYGFNLANYLCIEFDLPDRQPWSAEVRQIRFWDLDRFQEVRWRER
jgi:hypothetical protein